MDGTSYPGLFQTDAWQTAWWSEWGSTTGFQLVKEQGFGRSGIYLDCYRYKRVIPIRCLQFVGTNYRRLSTPRTEYNTLIGRDGHLTDGAKALRELLLEAPWDEAVFRDLRGDREEKQLLEELAKECGWLFRTVARDTAYAVKTVGSFSDYLRALGSSTRLRLYNRRKVLESCGDIRVTNAWPDQVDDFFERLNRFHSKRWGQPCFNEASVRFHKAFLERVGKEGGVPKLSELTCDGEVISQLYNVEYLGCLYNIQSGFVEGFHKKIALGTLHIGYSLEEAFESRDVNVFDMLAGQGKNENYKARMATCSQTLESVMLVQSPVLKFLYGLKEFLAKRHRLIG